MRIGIVTTWMERGAAYVARAYETVLRERHDVFIYARGGEADRSHDPQWAQPNVTWGPVGGRQRFASHPLDPESFGAWIRERRLEVVLFNEQYLWAPVLQARAAGALTGALVYAYYRQAVPLHGLYDFLLCNASCHQQVFDFHPQCLLVPWGTDLTLFSGPRLRSDSAPVVFFHAAGMSPWRKGTDLAIRAFQQVRGDAKLVIHSQAPASCVPTIGDAFLADPRIEFIHDSVAPPGLFHRGDYYLYPSRLDGIGLTIFEACACGLPVIATDAPPMNEFVRPGGNGWLVEVEHTVDNPWNYWPSTRASVPALTTALQALVDDPGPLRDHRLRARAWAEEHFDWRRNAAFLVDALPDLRRLTPAPGLLRAARWRDRWAAWRHGLGNLGLRRVARALHRRAGEDSPTAGVAASTWQADAAADKHGRGDHHV